MTGRVIHSGPIYVKGKVSFSHAATPCILDAAMGTLSVLRRALQAYCAYSTVGIGSPDLNFFLFLYSLIM